MYGAVLDSLETLLATTADAGHSLPGFVERELRAYLTCGLLPNGFARVRCPDCGFDRLVAFSCKGRGFCPSCLSRQMADTAARLVDHVLPHVPYRQWVLTLPVPVRYLVAYDATLHAEVLRAFLRAVFRWLRHKAKDLFDLRSVTHAHPGAVTVTQRAGSALNLNPHFHSIVTDGVFVQESPDHDPVFHALPAPNHGDIADVAWEACLATIDILRRRGLWTDAEPADDTLALDEPALAACAAASVHGTLATGPRAGGRVLRLYGAAANHNHDDTRVVQTPGYGFNLHAQRRVAAADRGGLERLCRYILRPPIANDRLRRQDDGTIHLRLTRPWRDGTTHIVFTPLELTEKLVPLIPAPRVNRIRYHGVFAPNARLRSALVPTPVGDTDPAECHDPTTPQRHPARLGWAALMARVFDIDVLECPKCKARMQQIAWVMRPSAIRAILDSVGLPADSPVPHPARLPEQADLLAS